MALVVKDRVKEVTTTTGTADFVLGGAVLGFQTFSVIGNGNQTYYSCSDPTTGAWEVGIGTYSTTGPTLTRDTVLESSNSGSKVSFAAGSKDIFCTYPAERSVYLDTAGLSVTTLDVGTLGTSTANITTANITAGTVSTAPATGNDIANKTYVDNMAASALHYHTPVYVESPNTTGNLNATYNNGASGVGATLTNAGTQAAFTADGVAVPLNARVLIYNQTNATQNGVYTLTTVGSGSTNWVLTRATDADTYAPSSPSSLGQGDAFFVTNGLTGAGETYVCNTVGTIIFGTTNITFAQISDATLYTAGTGLTLTGTEFSITNTGTAGTYGSSSNVPVFVTNAQGQVTSVTNTAIAITPGQVSGLAASATTDTTDASNITSGTLPTGRITGSYTGITGVGTLTAGTWNANVIGGAYGGTGLTSYAVGDLLYADTSSTLAKLADVAYGNVLLSGGVGTAPSYGKVSLTAHVTNTLAVANGGTGATTLTGYVYGNGTGAMTASTSIPNSATTATNANTASAIVARDASGNFSAGTITATLSGNASTATSATSATTATNLAGGAAGAVPYQSASGTTGFSAAGTSGQVLTSAGTSAPTWTTPATVNNGTLTMNVSGTGLSGSASFTANQSGSSTFTVTSNATSGNTASTIVARDASGNFSAGTITAALTGTASGNLPLSGGTVNGTVTLSSTNDAQLFLNGAGTSWAGIAWTDVSGTDYTWFNGSTSTFSIGGGGSAVSGKKLHVNGGMTVGSNYGGASNPTNGLNVEGAIQQAGNQVLHAGNYNSYSPTLTGGGASGTWGINITGNANTASSTPNPTFSGDSVDKDNITTRTDSGFYQSSTGTTAEGWPVNDNSWQHMIACTHSNDSNYYSMQIGGSFFDNVFYGRKTNGSGSTGWVQFLTSGNYSSYALPLSGGSLTTGASSNLFIGRNSTATNYNAISLNGNSADSSNMGLTGGGSGDSTLYINSPGSINVRTSSFGNSFWFSGANFSAPGAITSGGNNGFRNDVYYVGARNPIWSFGNATAYGLSYYQGSSGIGGADTIGLHPNGSTTSGGAAFAVTSSASYVNSNVVLHAGNYTSYSPSLTGSGASGTWGINVTGTASNISSYSINQNLSTSSTPSFAGVTLNSVTQTRAAGLVLLNTVDLSTVGSTTSSVDITTANPELYYELMLEIIQPKITTTTNSSSIAIQYIGASSGALTGAFYRSYYITLNSAYTQATTTLQTSMTVPTLTVFSSTSTSSSFASLRVVNTNSTSSRNNVSGFVDVTEGSAPIIGGFAYGTTISERISGIRVILTTTSRYFGGGFLKLYGLT